MTWDILAQATHNVRDRKRAAGLPADEDGTRYYAGLDTLTGVAVGLDLTVEELDAYSRGNAEHGVPYMLAVGPVSALASQRLGGLLDGVEYQRLRGLELEGRVRELGRRERYLRGALELVRRRVLDLASKRSTAGPGVPVDVTRGELVDVTRIVDTVLEADG